MKVNDKEQIAGGACVNVDNCSCCFETDILWERRRFTLLFNQFVKLFFFLKVQLLFVHAEKNIVSLFRVHGGVGCN